MVSHVVTFYRYLSTRRTWFALFVPVLVISSILASITPFYYKLFIDAILDKRLTDLSYLLGVYIIVRLAGLLFEELAFVFGDKAVAAAATRARLEIFRKVQDLDFAFHTNKSTGSLISAFKRGDNAVFTLYHALHFRIVSVFIGFFVMLYFLGSLDPLVGVTSAISFVVLMAVSYFVLSKNINARNAFNREEDAISGIIGDNLINYETVKLFAKEDWERERLKSAFIPWNQRLWDYWMSFRVFDSAIGILTTGSIALTLGLSVMLVSQGKMNIGNFVLVATFVNSFYPRVFDLVFGFRNIVKNFADLTKYFGILDEEVEIKDPVDPVDRKHHSVRGEIEFTNLVFSYKEGRKNALKGINLRIREGQSVALVGRSGSGKTTLVKLLMRFYDPDRGSISIDGVDISSFTKSKLRSFMGVVPQEPILFNNTIGYNIAYGKPGAKIKEIKAAAKLANIDSFIESLPNKYETNVGERGIKLSGGQKQRLAIARMILADPDIVVFDEATSHLDSESETLIQEAFWKAAKNKTTIVIAHRLSTIMRADKIVVMDKGTIVETGSHNELIAQDTLYRHLWELQTKNSERA